MRRSMDTLPLSGRDERFVMRTEGSTFCSLSDRELFYKGRRDSLADRERPTERDRLGSLSPLVNIYPYSRGLTLINDGVAYGERLAEQRVMTSDENHCVKETAHSLRTRTGKQRLNHGRDDAQ